ncbi:MAG TPA: hypothetical protein DCS07_15355 [Bdellovibrionales bacterium]|nr:MAG: hypothetical protein A2Z97_03265 [Bdellovibrionales bacterium GWB1_52_6]OFZ02892.1 MAG: hypothetical protein A2X97_04790 [Bdellovibrionales bacterium GWA1_52_35]OFZ44020.1 MAG: hypothetical protein A2070_06455 [Bdellovibrionales bacterium GWC1_52_8]HAR43987.1 hypothetical protein [Bdellovibrionales bacterium]HCM38475.1 hypothetical protein [Bdellovibrionales bacterium]
MKNISESSIRERIVRASAEGIAATSGFWEERSWSRKGRTAERFLEFIVPHSIEYFHAMRPLFVLLARNNAVLAHFSPLIVRDGALSLLHYFYHHPEPSVAEQLLLIPGKLRNLVPEAWIGQSAWYLPRTTRTTRDQLLDAERIEDFVFILTLIDERQASPKWLAAQLANIRKWSGQQPGKISFKCLVYFSGEFQVRKECFVESYPYAFEMIAKLQAELGSPVTPVTLPELLQRGLQRTIFLDVNEVDFYYSDSFIVHELMRRGALNYSSVTGSAGDRPEALPVVLPVSLLHEFEIGFHQKEESFKRLRTSEALASFRNNPVLAREELSYPVKGAFRSGKKFCSPAFESLAYDLAQELFRSCP